MNSKKTNVRALTECSIMIALSTVLSVIKIFEMPYGGSITLASMLPIVIIAYRLGIKYGLATAAVTSVIQLLLGLSNFSYFTTWYSLVALAVLDYIVAFCAFGLSGLFRNVIGKQNMALAAGAATASVIRYVCHVISGATVWAGLSIPTEAALIYSLSYNATYMIPETIILVLCAAYLGSAVDFRAASPTRIKNEKLDTASAYCLLGAGLSLISALIVDTILVFSKLQNGDSGELDITAIGSVNWLALAIVTAVALAVAAALLGYAKARMKKSK